MLDERALELLTAYVDGELTRRERKAALRLLNESSEARAVLGDLQKNVHRLRQLPRHQLPADFAASVLDAMQRPVAPMPGAAAALPRRRSRAWKGLAAAAAVLLAIVGGYCLRRPLDHGRPIEPPGPLVRTPKINPWVGSLIDGAVEHSAQPLPAGLEIAIRDLHETPKRERLAQELKK